MSAARKFIITLAALSLAIALPNVLAAQGPPGGPPGGGGSVSVTPDGATTPDRIANTDDHSEDFTVKNTGSGTDTFFISCGGSSNVTCTGVSPSQVTLGANQSTTVTADYDVGAVGTGNLDVTAFSEDTFAEDNGDYNVPVISALAVPEVDITPYNHETQQMGRCAASCFAVTHAQGTVPYVSHDTPRNVTLVYHGDRVDPKPFIHVNVRHPDSETPVPSKFWLEAKKDGVLLTFLNGETRLKFTAASSGWQRLAGQFNASSYSTGVYALDIIVTADYGGQGTQQKVTQTKLVVVNENNSSIARGWNIAGVQRLYVQGDGSAFITEGDGSAVYFQKSGSTFITPAGEFSKLVAGGGGGWDRFYPDSTQVSFNSSGRMTRVYDQFNNITNFTYVGNNLTLIADPANKMLSLTYGTYGLSSIRSTITPYRYTNFTVLSNKTLTKIKDPDNIATNFQYDGSKRLWKVTDRRSKTTTLAYDSLSGKLASVTVPAVPIFTEGTVSPVTQFAPWQPVGVPYTATSSTPAAMVRPADVKGTVTDPGNHATTFTVDRWGQPVASTDPLSTVTTISYNSNGLPVRTVNSTDTTAVDSLDYNFDGLVTYAKPTGGTATITTYGAWAQPTLILGDGQPSRTFKLGTNGRIDSTWVGGTKYTRFTYDSRGRVLTVKDGLNNLVQSFAYSGTNGNRSSVTLPGGRITTYGYDAYGRVTTVSTAGLPTRTTYYDLLNRPDSVKDGVNTKATRFGYDALYRTSVTDPKDQVYSFTHNALGWLTQQTDPVNKSDTYEYSKDGELKRWKNRRLESTDYAYDVMHRQTSKSGSNTDNTTFAYSDDGRRVKATSPMATDSIFLNVLGAAEKTWTQMGGKTYTRNYNYTQAGLLDSVWTNVSHETFLGRKYKYTTSRGTLDEIRVGGKSTSHTFNSNLQHTSTTFAGGDVVTRQYTTPHSTAKIESNQAGLDVLVRRLEHDTVGRIKTQYTDPIPVEFGTVFGYDGLNRVVRDTMGMIESDLCTFDPDNGYDCPPPTTDSVRSFIYDAVGNMTRDSLYRVWNGGTDVATGAYGTGNRITSFDGCSYQTDADGNVTQRSGCGSTANFYWSSENVLDSMTVGGQKIKNYYDAFGRLVKRDVYGTVSYYWWDGDNLFAELDATGQKKAEYSYYPGLDNLHALVDQDDSVYFAHSDGMGNVVGLVSDSKVLKRRYDYDLKGSLVGTGDIKPFSDRDRARFKGALWMGPEVDLYYMRNRWYETSTGRFLSEDPIGLGGGINVYAFAGNNPVSGRDPLGLCPPYPCDLPGVTVTGVREDPFADFDKMVGSDRDTFDGSGPGGFGWGGGGGGGGVVSGLQQSRSCSFNQNFLRQINEQFDLAANDGRERAGFYGAPWTSPVRLTAIGGPDFVRIPLRPGAAGYWHTHQNPPQTHLQGPSQDDLDFAVNRANSTLFAVARDSLYVISQNGSVTACGR